MSQRKSIIASDEVAANSPLRRSSRIATSSPAPDALPEITGRVTRRRSSATSDTVVAPAKIPKTKRLSLSQEVSTEKSAPATRSVRSRAKSKSPSFESEKKAPGTPRRTRRSSVTQTIEEEPEPPSAGATAVTGATTRRKSVRGQSTSPTHETKDPPKLRGRRGSTSEKTTPLDVIEETEPVKRTRGRPATRRTSVDSTIEEESDDAFKKMKSVTVQLEPLLEDKAETTRGRKSSLKNEDAEEKTKSTEDIDDPKTSKPESPLVEASKENVVRRKSLRKSNSPIKDDAKVEQESSQNQSKESNELESTENKSSRKSLRIAENTSPKSTTVVEVDQSPLIEKRKSLEPTESQKEDLVEDIQETTNKRKSLKEKLNSSTEKVAINEEDTAEKLESLLKETRKSLEKTPEKGSSPSDRRKSLRNKTPTPEKASKEVEKVEMEAPIEIVESTEEDVELELIVDEEKTDSKNETETKFDKEESVSNTFKSPKTLLQKKKDDEFLLNKVEITDGSDGSFQLNLSLPLSTNSQEKTETLNSSNGSSHSDKENAENSPKKIKTPLKSAEKTVKPLLSNDNNTSTPNVEKSFFEPMEVNYASDIDVANVTVEIDDVEEFGTSPVKKVQLVNEESVLLESFVDELNEADKKKASQEKNVEDFGCKRGRNSLEKRKSLKELAKETEKDDEKTEIDEDVLLSSFNRGRNSLEKRKSVKETGNDDEEAAIDEDVLLSSFNKGRNSLEKRKSVKETGNEDEETAIEEDVLLSGFNKGRISFEKRKSLKSPAKETEDDDKETDIDEEVLLSSFVDDLNDNTQEPKKSNRKSKSLLEAESEDKITSSDAKLSATHKKETPDKINISLKKLIPNEESESGSDEDIVLEMESPNKNKIEKVKREDKMLNDSYESELNDLISKKLEDFENDEEYEPPRNEFIDDEAFEGEEDTPSEGSNDIIDEGESLHSTDSEDRVSDDDYDSDDSFIAEDESIELLSGDEYDLTDEPVKKKKSRIICIESDDDSEEDTKETSVKSSNTDVASEHKSEDDVFLLDTDEDSADKETKKPPTKVNIIQEIVISPHPHQVRINPADNLTKLSTDDATVTSEPKTPNNSISETKTSSSKRKSKRRTASISIQENLSVDAITEGSISEKITKAVGFLCSNIKNKSGKVSLNVSLDYANSSNNSDDAANKLNAFDAELVADAEVPSLNNSKVEEIVMVSPQRLSDGSLLKNTNSSKKKKKRNSLNKTVDLEDSFTVSDDLNVSKSKNKRKSLNKSADLEENFTVSDDLNASKSKKKRKSASNSDFIVDEVENSNLHNNDIETETVEPELLSQEESESSLNTSKKRKKNKKRRSANNSVDLNTSKQSDSQEEAGNKKRRSRTSTYVVENIDDPKDEDDNELLNTSKKAKNKKRRSVIDAELITEIENQDHTDKELSNKKRRSLVAADDSLTATSQDEESQFNTSKKKKSMKRRSQENVDLNTSKQIEIDDSTAGPSKKRMSLEQEASSQENETKTTTKPKKMKTHKITPTQFSYLPENILTSLSPVSKTSSSEVAKKAKPKKKTVQIAPSSTFDGDDWQVDEITRIKPSTKNLKIKSKSSGDNKPSTQNKIKSAESDFDVNDFKNRMLFDPKRVNRSRKRGRKQ